MCRTILTVDAASLCPADIFESGQAFRFQKTPDGYEGVASGCVVKTVDKDGMVEIHTDLSEKWVRHYFDLDRDYTSLFPEADPVLQNAILHAPGLRVLNQEPFETLISFIVSANNNIARIRKIIASICREAGDPVNGQFTFPGPEQLATVSEDRLRELGCGYRAPYIAASSRRAADMDFDFLKTCAYPEAKKILMTFPGVGTKVADCICLFGLEKSDAFPVDVWMERVAKRLYGFMGTRRQIEQFGHDLFGENAGIAQQFLFHYARTLPAWEKNDESLQ